MLVPFRREREHATNDLSATRNVLAALLHELDFVDHYKIDLLALGERSDSRLRAGLLEHLVVQHDIKVLCRILPIRLERFADDLAVGEHCANRIVPALDDAVGATNGRHLCAYDSTREDG